jgi:hypothetical protein
MHIHVAPATELLHRVLWTFKLFNKTLGNSLPAELYPYFITILRGLYSLMPKFMVNDVQDLEERLI